MLSSFYDVCGGAVICSYAAVIQNWSNGVSQKMVLQTKGMSKQFCVVISFANRFTFGLCVSSRIYAFAFVISRQLLMQELGQRIYVLVYVGTISAMFLFVFSCSRCYPGHYRVL